jgi:hypothetical protein
MASIRASTDAPPSRLAAATNHTSGRSKSLVFFLLLMDVVGGIAVFHGGNGVIAGLVLV